MLCLSPFFIKLIITALVCLSLFISSYAQSITFSHLTVEDGLSNNDANTLIQDKTGFIWFGTEDGLNRYDGYKFKVFRNDPADSNSISDNAIWALLEDSKGYIWVGTKDGILNRFDPLTEKFSQWMLSKIKTNNSSITALYEDSKGNIWIGTRTRGVYKLNPVTGEIINWDRTNDSLKTSLSSQSVRTITEDGSGNIIIGTYFGMNKFNPDLQFTGFDKFFSKKDDPNSLSNSQIYNISKSKTEPDIFWIGTPSGLTKYNSSDNSFIRIDIPNPDKLQFGTGASTVIEEVINGEHLLWIDTYSGLIRMNLNSGIWTRFVQNDNNPHSLVDNQINKMIKDRSGVIWLATENGISHFSRSSSKFNSFFNKDFEFYQKAVEGKKNLKAIAKNENENVWFGFENGIVSTSNSGKIKKAGNIKLLDNINVWSMVEENNSLWIGTFGQGLKRYDLKTGEIENWSLIYSLTNTKTVPFVKSLFLDSKNNLWIGYWGSGIGRLNPSSGEYYIWNHIPASKNSLSSGDVWTIKEDSYGRIWIGTSGGGLNLLINEDEIRFRNWKQSADSKQSLSSNTIYSICISVQSNEINNSETLLWIGTSNGLNKFIIKNNPQNLYDFDWEIKTYNMIHGLNDNNINSILEDDNGNLWLGTGSGITYFNVSDESFTNFSASDGLKGSMMNPESSLKLKNGLMLFGSATGLNIFDPAKIKLSVYKPTVVITDFQIFNRSIKISYDSPLRQSIAYTKELSLAYNQDVFSFEFSALDFNSPQSIQYAYKMEGFDSDWTESGNRRYATYTNLDPGIYNFKIKSTNADGIWNDDAVSLRIIINPPWWATLWAYGLYTLLIIFGLLAIRRFEMNRTKLRNELRLSEFEAKQKTQLEEMKSRFFANLSHEFRTPLMLIKGPLENLKNININKNISDDVELIDRNSLKLQKLIDELLELSQLESASIPVKAEKENVILLLKGIVSSFESIAAERKINLVFNPDADSIITWIDIDKFEKIINNLLSNAVKFTPPEGKIEVVIYTAIENDKDLAELIIRDNGTGIPEDKLENIFDRFYQVDDSSQRTYGGSGIGLALVKEFVDLHKWNISVESQYGKGTQFKIKIPLWDDYLNEDEKVNYKLSNYSVAENLNNSSKKILAKHYNIEPIKKNSFDENDKPFVLIVDDSDDVRLYLKKILEIEFKIAEAVNGSEGIKSAIEINPDLIISDVMMPSMDGFEFCRQIKSDWHTSDIPIILLTAKASFESKLEGLEIGADEYLTKPFETRELFVRIKNLLEQRKRIREKYSKDINLIPPTPLLNDADQEFISKAYQLIEANLDKTNFNTENLAKELFLSRSQLHRKMSSITGQAPGELIRTIKLKRAADLLLENKLSVTQVAYEIGFSSPAQFTRAFSKQFNCYPSEYSARNQK